MHMRIQAHESNPNKANYKLRCMSVYSRRCTTQSTQWPLGMRLPHSSEDKKRCSWHKSCFTGICGGQYIGCCMPLSSRNSLLSREEIWNSRVISQTFQIHFLACLPHFPYDRCLSIVATPYNWHSTNVRSGKHVNQNTLPIPDPFLPPLASLLPRIHQQHSHWIASIFFFSGTSSPFRALASYSVP
jgi:hypothetical protein